MAPRNTCCCRFPLFFRQTNIGILYVPSVLLFLTKRCPVRKQDSRKRSQNFVPTARSDVHHVHLQKHGSLGSLHIPEEKSDLRENEGTGNIFLVYMPFLAGGLSTRGLGAGGEGVEHAPRSCLIRQMYHSLSLGPLRNVKLLRSLLAPREWNRSEREIYAPGFDVDIRAQAGKMLPFGVAIPSRLCWRTQNLLQATRKGLSL